MAAGSGLVLVSSENPVLARQLLGRARQVADRLGWEVAAAILDGETAPDCSALGSAGADSAYWFSGGASMADNPEAVTTALSALIKQIGPGLVLLGATKLGMEVVPRLAERNRAAYAAWATGCEIDPETKSVTATCMLYAGMGSVTYRFKPRLTLLSIAPGVFEESIPSEKEARLVEMVAPAGTPRIKVTGYQPKKTGSARLEEAKMVLDIGQGVKQREDLAMIQSVADLLGGQLSCSRPLSSDRDWFPDWLGLSGKKVKPTLCLTVGTSGAVQHMVGIRDSRMIVAVNLDENAGIFLQADYGVVADLYQFLPVFAERLKSRGIKPGWEV